MVEYNYGVCPNCGALMAYKTKDMVNNGYAECFTCKNKLYLKDLKKIYGKDFLEEKGDN